jgi:tetratricopeptide (TPR) repeat protein
MSDRSHNHDGNTADVLVGTAILLGVAFVVFPVLSQSRHDRLVHAAAIAWSDQRFDGALRFAEDALRERPNSPEALVIAGESAVRVAKPDAALEFFEKVPADGSAIGLQAAFGRAKRLYRLGRFTEAEAGLRATLKVAPAYFRANQLLAQLLQVQGRSWESIPYLTRVIRSGQFAADELILVGSSETKFVKDDQSLQMSSRARPDDLRPQLAGARKALLDKQFADVLKQLRRIQAAHPMFLPATLLEGQALVKEGSWTELIGWNSQLPHTADEFPTVWYCRGMWAREMGQNRAAVRCFLEVAHRNPNHLQSNYQLSQLFVALKRTKDAELFAKRSSELSKAEYLINDLQAGPDDHLLRQLVPILESLGRRWEAAAWCNMALRANIESDWATETLLKLNWDIQRDDLLVPISANPSFAYDLSKFPLPDWNARGWHQRSQQSSGGPLSSVRFRDEAAIAGLDYQYYNSMDPVIGLNRIFETTGGGVAVLDFDRDGLPDLYFANGCPLPEDSAGLNKPHPGYHDRLFRNRGDGRFDDVTFSARLGDDRFSQGVAVGDHNNDGYPDLFIANLGGNRFYENNGDGTFNEITAETGTSGNEWSMSGLLTDLNGDSLPDLYVVNYLQKDPVFQRDCKRDGKPLTCAPTLFPAEQDRLYLNLGDGTYRDVTEDAGIVVPDGKGLGIVAADFDGSGKLNLFVGNDTAPNFYFVNQTPTPQGTPRFAEAGMTSGLAVNDGGETQACMGIATVDADGDGRVDLFVTNFFADYNTLYLNRGGGIFADCSRSFNLTNSSYSMLGFGTQSVDGELDGWPDIVLTNGHVDQTSATSEPDAMPPQYYQNLRGRSFREVSAESLGPYFQKKSIGRSMARLDWNGDGLDDVCIVTLDAPAALLTNTTDDAGHFVTFVLSGRDCHRDAIGTVITLTTQGGRKIVRQLTAGDGYQSSNERRLTFGLGKETEIAYVTVRWICGRTQEFTSLVANAHYQLTESSRPVRLLR